MQTMDFGDNDVLTLYLKNIKSMRKREGKKIERKVKWTNEY